MQTFTIDEIIAAFSNFDGGYRRQEVDAALAMQAEITPRLIGLLEQVLRTPAKFADEEDFAGHLYAVMLLGYFGEPRAHQVIVDLLRLPSRLVDDLFSDMVTEDMPSILYRTSGGSLEQIKALARDRKADDYSRNAAVRAMTYAVADGAASRDEVVEFIGSLMNKQAISRDSALWGLLAADVHDLHPAGIMDVIKQAYDEDLVDASIITYQEIKAGLKDSPEIGLNRIRIEMQAYERSDFHDRMSWWTMFDQAAPSSQQRTTTTLAAKPLPPASSQGDAKLSRQQRRKLERESAKAAKKKGQSRR